jgi:hypothetical protein
MVQVIPHRGQNIKAIRHYPSYMPFILIFRYSEEKKDYECSSPYYVRRVRKQ